MRSSVLDFIPIVEFKQIDSLTGQDKGALSNSSRFLVSVDSNEYCPYLKENKFILIDTNEELRKKDLILATEKENSPEFFQFIGEIEGQWKIKVKSLKNGKKYIKNLNNFTIYGAAISERKVKNSEVQKKSSFKSCILTEGITYNSSRCGLGFEQNSQNF